MEDQVAQKNFSGYIKKATLNLSKLNQMGAPKQFFTNQLNVQYVGQKEVYQYAISFVPEVPSDSREVIQKLLKGAQKDEQFIQKLGQDTYWSGEILYSKKECKESVFASVKLENTEYQVVFKFTRSVSMQDLNVDSGKNSNASTQQVNIQLKNILKQLGLREMGRQKKYYDSKKIFNTRVEYQTDYDLFCHTGYSASIVFAERGNMIQIDNTTRIINTKTLLDHLKEQSPEDLIGKTVIADYGNHRNYRIDGFHLNQTPLSTFVKSDGTKISYKDYFFKQYQVKIKDDKQPIAFNIDKRTQRETCLVPELMITTGISDRQRSDYKLMNEIAKYTKLTPNQRVEKFNQISADLINAANKGGNIKIMPGTNLTDGVQLHTPRIKTGKQFDQIQGGQFQLRNSILSPMNLKNWIFIYTSKGKRDDDTADRFVDDLKKVCQGFGIQVENPGFIVVQNDNAKQYIQELKKDIQKNGNPDFVLSMSFAKTNYYSDLKDYLLGEVGVPHSHFTIKSWEKSKLAGVTKIVTQINAKMDKPVWEVEQILDQPKGLMVIGVDSCSFMQGGKKKTCIGIVATQNQSLTQTWSKAIICINDQQQYNIVNSIGDVIKEAVQAYAKNNKALPTHIVLYRDGSGSTQIPVIVGQEISKIQSGFSSIDPKYKPEFVYIMFNKKVNFRFFEQASGGGGGQRGGKGASVGYDNPNPGALIYKDVTAQNYEFYLVPQKVTQGSATPTKFIVCYNESRMEQQFIFQLTYFQCYNYYNWSGAVRVPGVAQYARKLASLVGDNFKRPVHENLRKGQYYL